MTSESSIQVPASSSAALSAVVSATPSAALFDEVANELYATPPHSFVALRAQWADGARAAGAPDVAVRIGKLRVPSAAAWMSNQLVRHHRDQVLVMLDLGRALQVATGTLDGAAIRQLDERRRVLCGTLHRLATLMAFEERVAMGPAVLRGLGDSLHAAMCSEGMAQEMLAGRLVRPLPRISWPGLASNHAPDELSRRRALRVSRGVEGRPGRYASEDDDTEHGADEGTAPLATVTNLFGRPR